MHWKSFLGEKNCPAHLRQQMLPGPCPALHTQAPSSAHFKALSACSWFSPSLHLDTFIPPHSLPVNKSLLTVILSMSPWRLKTFIDIILSESQAQKLECGLIPFIWYFPKAQLWGWRTDPWDPSVRRSLCEGASWSDSIALFSDKCSGYMQIRMLSFIQLTVYIPSNNQL